MLAQILKGLDALRMVAGDAEHLLAEERLGGHCRGGIAGVVVAPVAGQAMSGADAAINEELDHFLPRFGGHGDAERLVGALERHELPAEHAHVADLPSLVPPSAIG